jgi:Ni/Co efflux regulator RcnB
MEDAMKGSLTLLSLVLAGAVFTATPISANQAATENKETAKKETKWQGHVVRINTEESQMDIRGGVSGRSDEVRKVAFDSSTEWTKGGKPGQKDEVKEGSFVIVLGKVDDKGVLHASRIDLRLPR